MAIEISSSSKEGCNWLHLKGDLSSEVSAKLREAAGEFLTDAPAPLVVDLMEVSYIDSSGLGTLIFLHKNWRQRNGKMLLYCPSPLVKKFLATTGLLRVFLVACNAAELQQTIVDVEKQL